MSSLMNNLIEEVALFWKPVLLTATSTSIISYLSGMTPNFYSALTVGSIAGGSYFVTLFAFLFIVANAFGLNK